MGEAGAAEVLTFAWCSVGTQAAALGKVHIFSLFFLNPFWADTLVVKGQRSRKDTWC